MTPHEPNSIDRVYWDAAQLSGDDQRQAYLDQACGEDTQLRRRVEELLEAAADAGDFLETPVGRIGAFADQPPTEGPGTRIGPYKLIEQIGEGGFGIVFMAEQTEPVRRMVALKIIKPGMDTRQVIARFEAERQALAMMDHPNIAKVLDAGIVGVQAVAGDDSQENTLKRELQPGRPYFVMELVKGVPITTYCDENRLTLTQRLELFIPVCQAVQHAHQKGVIHRDLKSTNVLVANYDNVAVPKVIDFGVAKATGAKLTERTLFTQFGQVIGTMEYMSPEQARLNQLDVDTRTDIYSLGVLLYELLTGSTPFDQKRLRSVPFDEMLRIIREEEPLRPSTRLTTLESAPLKTICDRQRVDTRQLTQQLRGELDWIVMKCLDKERDRRYDAAASLAADLQHYLDDEPVKACPPSAMYRMQKFARRNRGGLLAAAVILLTLVAASAISTWLAVRAIDAERLAAERLAAESLAHYQAERSFQKARQAVDDMYTQVAEKWLANQPQMEPVQREFLEKALLFYSEAAQRSGTEAPVRFEAARAQRRMAEIQHRLGQPGPAEVAFLQATDRLQALTDEFADEASYRSELAATLHQLGVLLGDTGRYADEEQAHRRALAIEQDLAADSAANAEHKSRLGRAHFFVGQVLLHLRRKAEAESALQSARAIQNSLAAEYPSVATHRHHLAQTYIRLSQALVYGRRTPEHEQALRHAANLLEDLVSEFPRLPTYRNELANVYYWMMRKLPTKEAEEYLRRALALQERLAAEYPSVTDYRYDLSRSQKDLGDLLAQTDRIEEADESYRRALAVAEKLVAGAPTVHYYRARLALIELARGRLFEQSGKPSEAQVAYEHAIGRFKSLVEEYPGVWQYPPYLRAAYGNLASLLTATGRAEDAASVNRAVELLGPQNTGAIDPDAEALSDRAFGDETNEQPRTMKK